MAQEFYLFIILFIYIFIYFIYIFIYLFYYIYLYIYIFIYLFIYLILTRKLLGCSVWSRKISSLHACRHPVCGMVHIKEPLLLIDKSSLCGGSGFPFSLSEWSLTIIMSNAI